MTRDKFIRKWLANPQKQYNEQCRDEMRDDLDLLIQGAIGKLEQKQLITEIMSEDAKDGLYKKQTSVEWLSKQLWKTPQYETEWQKVIEQAKEIHRVEIIESYASGSNDRLKNRINTNYYNETFGGNNEQH